MLDEKSRQDVDTNLQDVAQIPGRRLRLWSFTCRPSVRGPMRSMGQGKTGASRFSLRDSIQEETVFAILSQLKRFRGTKRFRKYIWCDLKRLFGTKLCGQHQSGPENGVNNRPFCHRLFLQITKNGVNNDVILHRFGRRDFTLPGTTT